MACSGSTPSRTSQQKALGQDLAREPVASGAQRGPVWLSRPVWLYCQGRDGRRLPRDVREALSLAMNPDMTFAAVPHLAEFIRSRKEEILRDWEDEVRQLSSARRVPRPVLIDHLPRLVDQIAALIDEITMGKVSEESRQAAREHGFSRLDARFAVPEVIREYFVLRDCIARRWRAEHPTAASDSARFVLDRAIDETLIASVDEYMHVLRQEADTRMRQQQEAKREAQEAARAREDVMAIVSHDLRSPLQAIFMAAASQIRVAGDQARPIRNYAETIQRSAQRMSRLIDDLGDIALIESGRLTIEPTAEDPESIVRDVADSFRGTAAEHRTDIRCDLADPLPLVRCDRERIVQALSNIVGNAVKVTVGGTVTIRASADDREVAFAVSDTGPGIAPEDLPRIFQRYWRSEAAGYKGTGLGLAIVKGIVDTHGGRCWAESRPGGGSTFVIALPR